MTGLLIIVITLVLVGLGWYYASTRESATAVTAKPRRLEAFATARPPYDVLHRIREKTPGSAYTLDSVDEDAFTLILSTQPSATTWGFFYPVYLTPQDDGGTRVEVGIQSKIFQVGPIVRREHKRCLAFLREVIEAEEGAG